VLTTCADLSHGQSGEVAAAATGPGGGATVAPCTVRYLTRSDVAGQFEVDLTVTNTTVDQVSGWALQFRFNGDQTLREGTAGEWSQSPSGTVTVRDSATGGSLAPGASAKVGFLAEYHAANPMPTAFTLGRAACSYVLVGASGETQTGGPGASPGSDGEAAGGLQGGVPVGGNQGPVPGTPTGGGTTGGAPVDPVPAPAPTTAGPDPVPTNKHGKPKPTRTRTKKPKPDPSQTVAPLCAATVCVQTSG
jgi:hypothetical protein